VPIVEEMCRLKASRPKSFIRNVLARGKLVVHLAVSHAQALRMFKNFDTKRPRTSRKHRNQLPHWTLRRDEFNEHPQ
jgi:hypothetical protein